VSKQTINGSPGLVTSANPALASPGSLKRSSGCIIKRTGVVEKLRPWRQYSAHATNGVGVYTGTDIMLGVGDRLILCDDTGTVAWCEGAALVGAFGAITSPTFARYDNDAYGFREMYAGGNAYYTNETDSLAKQDTAGGNFYRAGVPRALDPQLTLVASGTLLAVNQIAAYRVCFTYKDANGNLTIGPPSGRVLVTATGAQNVSLACFIPAFIYGAAAAVAITYRIQVYRADIVTTTPTDEMQLVYDGALTAADIANKYTTIVDFTPDALKGPTLYTSPSQETLIGASEAPPPARDVCMFKGRSWFANTRQKHRATLQMIGLPQRYTIASIANVGGNSWKYTFSGSPDLTNIPVDGTAELTALGCTAGANDGNFPITALVAATSITVTNAAGVAQAAPAGYAMATRLTIAGTNYYASLNAESVANKRYLVGNVDPAYTQAQIQSAAASLIRVVNQTVAATVVMYNASGDDDAAGQMSIEEKSIGGSAFTAFAAGDVYSTRWAPTITSTFPLTSLNDAKANRLHYSKRDKAESCPLGQFFDLGAADKRILRLAPLREALLVFKEDGMWRVTADGVATPAFAPFDLTQIILSTKLATTLHNKCYAITTRGAWEFTESTSRYIGDPVANKISRFTDSPLNYQYGATDETSAGLDASASESDNAAYFSLSDGTGLLALAYNATNGTWTEQDTTDGGVTGQVVFSSGATCARRGARFNLERDTSDVYMEDQYIDTALGGYPEFYDGDSGPAYQLTGQPLPGHKYLIDISAVGATDITATIRAGPAFRVGNLVRENNGGTALYRITAINGAVLTLAQFVSGTGSMLFTAASDTYHYVQQPMQVEWNEFTAGDDADGKRWAAAIVVLDPVSTATADSCTISTYTDTDSTLQATTAPPDAGDGVEVWIPASQQFARELSVRFEHSNPGEYVLIRGIGLTVEEVAAWKDSN